MLEDAILEPQEAITALTAATHGLIYLSETDAPFEVLSGSTSEQLIPAPPGTPTETRAIDAFFGPLAKAEPWHDVQGKAAVLRYRLLQQFFTQQLKAAKVVRLGHIRIDVYIVGQARDGSWVGVKTQAVET